MSQELYSVEQVAERLGLNVRTVRAYVRDGRLNALKIGKQYRITRADLDAFLGPAAEAVAASRGPEVSSIVEMQDVDRERSIRLTNLVLAAAGGRPRERGGLSVATLYDEDARRLKLVLVGGLGVTADLLKLIETWLGQGR